VHHLVKGVQEGDGGGMGTGRESQVREEEDRFSNSPRKGASENRKLEIGICTTTVS